MTRNFSKLASELKREWSDDAARVYEEASEGYAHEIASRRALGESLSTIRRERGLTQKALSQASNIQQSEISRIESGRGNPTLDTLTRLAGAVGASVTLDVVGRKPN